MNFSLFLSRAPRNMYKKRPFLSTMSFLTFKKPYSQPKLTFAKSIAALSTMYSPKNTPKDTKEEIIIKFEQDEDEQRIPRPMNSFMIFRREKQKEISSKCQGASHRDMSKVIAKWWRELKPKEKQIYVDEAERLQLAHKQKYPNYKFQPKRKTKAPRSYKRCPADELVARDVRDKQNLLSLYHFGTILNDKQPVQLQDKLDIPPKNQSKKPKTAANTHTKTPQLLPYNSMSVFPSSYPVSSVNSPSCASLSGLSTSIPTSYADYCQYSTTPYSMTTEDEASETYSTPHYFQPQYPAYTATLSNPIPMLSSPFVYTMHGSTTNSSRICCESNHSDNIVLPTSDEQFFSHYLVDPYITSSAVATTAANDSVDTASNYDTYYCYPPESNLNLF